MAEVLVYFGAGGAGVSYLDHSGVRPDFFVDNDKAIIGKEVDGVPVRAPDSLKGLGGVKVVITSGYVSEIRGQLREFGVPDESVSLIPKSMMGAHIFRSYMSRVAAAQRLAEFVGTLRARASMVAVGGTALGFVRDLDFIPWDFDVDFFAPNSQRSDIERQLSCRGNEILNSESTALQGELSFGASRTIPIGIDFFDHTQDRYVDNYGAHTWIWPVGMLVKPREVKVHGQSFSVPGDAAGYLERVFGPDWRSPRPDFTYDDYSSEN